MLRFAEVERQSQALHASFSAARSVTSARAGTRCMASGGQPQMEFSMARTPAESPVKYSSKYTETRPGPTGK
eukprot:599492-Pleurochrysis_carterae.AAC.1